MWARCENWPNHCFCNLNSFALLSYMWNNNLVFLKYCQQPKRIVAIDVGNSWYERMSRHSHSVTKFKQGKKKKKIEFSWSVITVSLWYIIKCAVYISVMCTIFTLYNSNSSTCPWSWFNVIYQREWPYHLYNGNMQSAWQSFSCYWLLGLELIFTDIQFCTGWTFSFTNCLKLMCKIFFIGMIFHNKSIKFWSNESFCLYCWLNQPIVYI